MYCLQQGAKAFSENGTIMFSCSDLTCEIRALAGNVRVDLLSNYSFVRSGSCVH